VIYHSGGSWGKDRAGQSTELAINIPAGKNS